MKKILVIDDSRIARQQVINALGEVFEVLEAANGREGLAVVRSATDLRLVICDVNMPGMSGIEVLAQLKAVPLDNAPPFLMLTSEGQPELVNEAKRNGAKAWMLKPFKAEQLMAAAKKLACVKDVA